MLLDPSTYVVDSDSSNESEDEESPFVCEVLNKYQVKIIPQSPPKFKHTDPEARKYFEENGYVVFPRLASDEEVSHAIDLFWNHLENESKKKVHLLHCIPKTIHIDLSCADTEGRCPYVDRSKRMAIVCGRIVHWPW